MNRLNFFQNRPKATKIDTNDYLTRIHEEKQPPSINYLQKLHRSHLIHIPFENLDIHYQKKILLDYDKIFEKVVKKNRGGYCYELNGLFYHLLYHLGFDCYLISAKVKNEDSEKFGRAFDHMAIVVHLEQANWLVDVGFGKSIIFPKKIEEGVVQMDHIDYWRFSKDPDGNFLLQNSEDASYFKTKYLFSLEERQIIQFMEMNEYHQTASESPFTQRRLITKLTTTGRITLTDNKLKILSLGKFEENDLSNVDEFYAKLEQHFGITFKQLVERN